MKAILIDLLLDLIDQTEPLYLPVITDDELRSIARDGVESPYCYEEFTEWQRRNHQMPTTKVIGVNYTRSDGWEVQVLHTYKPGVTMVVYGCGFHPEEAASDVNAKLLLLREQAEYLPYGELTGGWLVRR